MVNKQNHVYATVNGVVYEVMNLAVWDNEMSTSEWITSHHVNGMVRRGGPFTFAYFTDCVDISTPNQTRWSYLAVPIILYVLTDTFISFFTLYLFVRRLIEVCLCLSLAALYTPI